MFLLYSDFWNCMNRTLLLQYTLKWYFFNYICLIDWLLFNVYFILQSYNFEL